MGKYNTMIDLLGKDPSVFFSFFSAWNTEGVKTAAYLPNKLVSTVWFW